MKISELTDSLVALSVLYKRVHWNLHDHDALALHVQLDEYKAELDAVTDRLAESARAYRETLGENFFNPLTGRGTHVKADAVDVLIHAIDAVMVQAEYVDTGGEYGREVDNILDDIAEMLVNHRWLISLA